MKPPQEIEDFLIQEHLTYEWTHPHTTLLLCRRYAQSMLHDTDGYLHPFIKDYLTNNLKTTYLINPSI